MKAQMFNISFVSCDIWYFSVSGLFILLEKAELFIFRDMFDLDLHSCLLMRDFFLTFMRGSFITIAMVSVASPYFACVLSHFVSFVWFCFGIFVLSWTLVPNKLGFKSVPRRSPPSRSFLAFRSYDYRQIFFSHWSTFCIKSPNRPEERKGGNKREKAGG